jgi:hypothetical protein
MPDITGQVENLRKFLQKSAKKFTTIFLYVPTPAENRTDAPRRSWAKMASVEAHDDEEGQT